MSRSGRMSCHVNPRHSRRRRATKDKEGKSHPLNSNLVIILGTKIIFQEMDDEEEGEKEKNSFPLILMQFIWKYELPPFSFRSIGKKEVACGHWENHRLDCCVYYNWSFDLSGRQYISQNESLRCNISRPFAGERPTVKIKHSFPTNESIVAHY